MLEQTRLLLRFEIIFVLISIKCSAQNITTKKILRDHLLAETQYNFTDFAHKYGLKVQEYEVVTEDDYVLMVFRVRTMGGGGGAGGGAPVLVSHGIACSADTLIMRGRSSLVARLAERGHDVWAANWRGGRYARKHVRLNPDTDRAYWDFSFHEMAARDLPATIDRVLVETGAPSLLAVGHSQGNTLFFALGALRPEYNDKVRVLVALGPTAFLYDLKPAAKLLMYGVRTLDAVFAALGWEEWLGDRTPGKALLELLCLQRPLSYALCTDGLFFVFDGRDPEGVDERFLPILYSHYPAGHSRKNLLHLAQLEPVDRFCQFDYGPEENVRRYASRQPPEYELRQMRMPVALYAGRNDGFCPLHNVRRLARLLPNVVEFRLMEPDKWNHLDFIWSTQMDKYLYPHLFKTLDKYNF